MSRVTVRVRGIPQLAARARLALKNIEEGTERALDTVAEATLAESKANTPVKTGKLRDSEEIESERLRRLIGTNLFYGPFVHDGTVHMAARPFLFNAFEANRNKLVSEIKKIKVL